MLNVYLLFKILTRKMNERFPVNKWSRQTAHDCDRLAQLTAYYICYKYKFKILNKKPWIKNLLPVVKSNMIYNYLGYVGERVNFKYLLDGNYFGDELP